MTVPVYWRLPVQSTEEHVSEARPISHIRLDGGRLCIDFANSIHNRSAADVEDYIATPERYVEWARRSGAIATNEAMDTPLRAGERERLMADIRSLRDAVYLLLLASADCAPLPADALLVQNAWLKLARQSQVLSETGVLTFHAERDDARFPLKRIALDLIDTIADARAGKLKLRLCANHRSCGWLFADTSKNGMRRWCAMETCGTISKMATRRNKSAPLSSDALRRTQQ
jgi:predicted RNA-binding Zn ribbon-like protein